MGQFYSLDKIIKLNAQFNMIFGSRSSGKSYACKKYVIDNFFNEGKEFVLTKRYQEDLKTKVCSTYFSDLSEYVEEKYNSKIKYYQGKFYVYDKETDGKLANCKVIGYSLAINTSDRVKGMTLTNVSTIIFEEFQSMDCNYLKDEINLFINLISTIFRKRVDGKVFLLGNTISKYSPYNEALGLNIHELPKGKIIEKIYEDKHGNKTKFAIERTKNVKVDNVDKEKIVYTNFGNVNMGNMINEGEWETLHYNKFCNGWCFKENIKDKPKGEIKEIGYNSRTNIYIQYLNYFYEIYFMEDYNNTVGVKKINYKPFPNKLREGERKKKVDLKSRIFFIINSNVNIKNVVNVNRLDCFSYSEKVNILFDKIINCFLQGHFVVMNDDEGQDVVSGLRLANLNL